LLLQLGGFVHVCVAFNFLKPSRFFTYHQV